MRAVWWAWCRMCESKAAILGHGKKKPPAKAVVGVDVLIRSPAVPTLQEGWRFARDRGRWEAPTDWKKSWG